MLAFLGNLSVTETLIVAFLAVLVFGRRLPEVAVRVTRWFQDLTRSFDEFRRQTGIDEEFRQVRKSFREVSDEARVEDPFRLPPEPRAERAEPFRPLPPPRKPAEGSAGEGERASAPGEGGAETADDAAEGSTPREAGGGDA